MSLDLSQTLSTSRARFHLRQSSGARGQPVLLLHGWPQSSYCWRPVARHLPAAWQLFAPDLRGLGDSERGGEIRDYEKQQLARDMLELLDQLELPQVHLVGHDWGGVVAQEMALQAPGRVRSLCLINILIINNRSGHLAAAAQLARSGSRSQWYQYFLQAAGGLFETLVSGREAAWLDYLYARPDRPGRVVPDDAFAEYLRCFSQPGALRAGANYYRSMRADQARWKTLAGQKFSMPSLYLYGEQDPVIVSGHLEGMEACFEQVELQRLPGIGHFVPEEAPETVAQQLHRFWQAQELA